MNALGRRSDRLQPQLTLFAGAPGFVITMDQVQGAASEQAGFVLQAPQDGPKSDVILCVIAYSGMEARKEVGLKGPAAPVRANAPNQ